eukprot:CAMPEP_0174376162 /NCGR_PEP_ID=MMETSP0811_2-20130205/117183_1 /TAXON_ID=73025 ORGANISM="Eutreptiella gymnastica-like, Strain CCMP1594" /NCGR_SAMPLE_ID=MMETSP0811_2 /ASSEMBLY_ACC=CAM_ASM_000667 /LENGTH=32 /DNA_ID= /DNA_START= /DNA_END= /DNA_ORIENTATION=
MMAAPAHGQSPTSLFTWDDCEPAATPVGSGDV